MPPVTVTIDLPPWMVFVYLFILGAVVGSFLNVCIYRIPTQLRLTDQLRALWSRPSQCPRCRTNIRWYDNIPIVGWLKLRGRCRNCRMWISPRYPAIECLNGLLWVLVFWMEVPLGYWRPLTASCVYSELGPQAFPGLAPFSPEWFVLARFAFHIVLIEALLVATFIDFDLRIIPDGCTLPAMLFGVVASTALARVHLVPVWFQSPNMLQSFSLITPDWLHPLLRGAQVPGWITAYPQWHGLVHSVVGLLVGGALTWLVRWTASTLLGEEAMGDGDVVLMAMIGAFLGWQATLIAFFLAPLAAILAVSGMALWRLTRRALGSDVSQADRMIPYGPYLSLGALLTILFWQPLFARTQHFFELGILLAPMVVLLLTLFAASLLLVQGVKRALGIRSTHVATPASWRSADQTWFFQGEHVDRHAVTWRVRDWDGVASGRGQITGERWRGAPQRRPWERR